MRFNLELVRNQLVTKQQTIASDYGIQHANRNPEAFARQIVTALNQPPVRDPLHQDIDDRSLYRAAVLAIWSSATKWASVIKRQDSVAKILHGYDPIKTYDSNVSKDDLANQLGSQYSKSQATRMLEWATLLVATPNYYGHVIRPIAEQLQRLAGAGNLTDQELMLCLAVLFAEGPPKRWEGYEDLSVDIRSAPLKFPGMGFPICCEFFRNLGWSGFKPDVHITRLFQHWEITLALPLGKYRPRAEELVALVGRRSATMIKSVQLGLAGIDLTPTGVEASEADNLIWLLGAYVERKGKESRERYLDGCD